jgi:O-antigen ligase
VNLLDVQTPPFGHKPAVARYHQPMDTTGLEASGRHSFAHVLAEAMLVALIAYSAVAMAIQLSIEKVQFGVGPLHVYLLDVLLAGVVLLLVRESVVQDSPRLPTANRRVLFLVAAYCAYQFTVIVPASVMLHDLNLISAMRAVESRIAVMLIPFVYLVAAKYLPTRRIITLMNVAAVIMALYVLYHFKTVGADVQGGFRLRELWGGATLLFGFLVITSVFFARPSVVSFAAAGLGLIGITLTNHRSGYLALLVVFIPLALHFRHASKRILMLLLLAVVSAALLLTASATIRNSTYYSLRTMLNPNADRNSIDRVDRSRMGWDYFVAHPFGDYVWSQRHYLVYVRDDFEPHNFVVQILDEQGIIGFALFVAIVIPLLAIGWRNRADQTSVVMLACLAFYLFFCLFNTNVLNAWNVMLLAVPAGLVLSRNAALAQLETSPSLNPALLASD